jgi:hypothetical protein
VAVKVTDWPYVEGFAEEATVITGDVEDVKVNWSSALVTLVPEAVVTVTSTVPGTWTGLTASISLGDTTVKLAAGTSPKLTAVAPARPAPVIVIGVPPAGEALRTLSDVTLGTASAATTPSEISIVAVVGVGVVESVA